jgi:iron complex outermembrane receptor protein
MVATKKFRLLTSVATLGGLFALAPGFGGPEAFAQDAAAEQAESVFEEIVVTARKREESLYETPMAITAFSGDSMKARNVTSLDDIGKYVPNLNITRFGIGNMAHAAVFIRGIGIQDHIITTDPGVGVYVDGVYLGRQMGANLNLSNVERVEVLRGPQGTLYGRNTIGGAINIITQKPGAEESFRLNLTGGTRKRASADFYGTFKLSDNLGMSVMGAIDRRDGVGKALRVVEKVRAVGQIFEASGRVALDWQASESFSLLFTVDAVQGENGQSPSTIEIIPGMTGFATDPSDPFGIFGPEGPLDESDMPANPDDTNTAEGNLLANSHTGIGTSLTADITLSENISAKVIGSYRHSDYTGGVDDEGVFTDFQSFPERGEADQVSAEIQLNGEYDRLDFVSGLYYFTEKGDTFSGINTFIFNGDTFDINQTTKSYAGYVHVGYQVAEGLRVAGGLRYTSDKKDADALFTNFPWFLPPPDGNLAQRVYQSDKWNAVTWNFNVNYDLSDEMNFYASVSRGYQNGGYPARPFGGPGQFVSFDPTYAVNYEAGIKGTIGDFMQLYLSLFHTRYKDLALQFSDPSIAGFVTITANAGRSRATGIELESTVRLSDAFSVQSTFGYIDAEVTQVNAGVIGVAEGDTPTLTPKYTISIAPEYVVEMDNGNTLTFRADYSYRSDMFGQSINNEFNRLEGRSLVGYNIRYDNPEMGWSVSLYGKNVLNKVYDVARLDQAFSGFTEIIVSNDRSEFGIKLSKAFGGY